MAVFSISTTDLLLYKHPAKSCCLILWRLLQLVTNLLSNYPKRAGLGKSEALQSLIQHLLFCINVQILNCWELRT